MGEASSRWPQTYSNGNHRRAVPPGQIDANSRGVPDVCWTPALAMASAPGPGIYCVIAADPSTGETFIDLLKRRLQRGRWYLPVGMKGYLVEEYVKERRWRNAGNAVP